MTDDAAKPTELGNHYQISDLAPLSSPTPSKAVQVMLGWGIKIIFRKQNSIFKGIFYSDFLQKAIPDEKCEAKKSMKREVGRASPSKTGKDQEEEACKELKLTNFVSITFQPYPWSFAALCSQGWEGQAKRGVSEKGAKTRSQTLAQFLTQSDFDLGSLLRSTPW